MIARLLDITRWADGLLLLLKTVPADPAACLLFDSHEAPAALASSGERRASVEQLVMASSATTCREVAVMVAAYTTAVSPAWLLAAAAGEGTVVARRVFCWDDAWPELSRTVARRYPLALDRLEETVQMGSDLLTSSLLQRGMSAERVWQLVAAVFGSAVVRSGNGQVVVLTDSGSRPASKSFIYDLLSYSLPTRSVDHAIVCNARPFYCFAPSPGKRFCVRVAVSEAAPMCTVTCNPSAAHLHLLVGPAHSVTQEVLRVAADVFRLPGFGSEGYFPVGAYEERQTAARLYLLGLRALSVL